MFPLYLFLLFLSLSLFLKNTLIVSKQRNDGVNGLIYFRTTCFGMEEVELTSLVNRNFWLHSNGFVVGYCLIKEYRTKKRLVGSLFVSNLLCKLKKWLRDLKRFLFCVRAFSFSVSAEVIRKLELL